MNENQIQNIDELLAKIDDFEKTITELFANIKKFRVKLLENKEKYGSDPSKWPTK